MVCCRESWSQGPLCLMWQGHIMKHALSENRNENKTEKYARKQGFIWCLNNKETKTKYNWLAPCWSRHSGSVQETEQRSSENPADHTPTTKGRNSENKSKGEKEMPRLCASMCMRKIKNEKILLSKESPAVYGPFLGLTTNSAVPQQRDRAPARRHARSWQGCDVAIDHNSLKTWWFALLNL